MSRTFTVRGIKVRSSSQRRFVMIQHFRKTTPPGEEQRWGAEIVKRSDSVATLRSFAQRQGFWAGRTFHIFDSTTGEEV